MWNCDDQWYELKTEALENRERFLEYMNEFAKENPEFTPPDKSLVADYGEVFKGWDMVADGGYHRCKCTTVDDETVRRNFIGEEDHRGNKIPVPFRPGPVPGSSTGISTRSPKFPPIQKSNSELKEKLFSLLENTPGLPENDPVMETDLCSSPEVIPGSQGSRTSKSSQEITKKAQKAPSQIIPGSQRKSQPDPVSIYTHKIIPDDKLNKFSDDNPIPGPSRQKSSEIIVLEDLTSKIPSKFTPPQIGSTKQSRMDLDGKQNEEPMEQVTISSDSDDNGDDDVNNILRNDFQSALEFHAKQAPAPKDDNPLQEILDSKPRTLGLAAPFRMPMDLSEENKKKERGSTSDSSLDISKKCKYIDKALIDIIKNEIMETTKNVTWDDISGLEYAKSIIQETVVMPILRPDLFTGLRKPARGILLFGPPGTGKTMIGKCVASQSNSKFFSISASTLTSKWIGESEKLVRALFDVAAAYQPSVIFIDEIDSLLSKRRENEQESTRRLKTEFMVRLDGATTSEDDRVLIIGATNRPQELDDAVRRRLVKRLYIPLPEEKARGDMLRRLLEKVNNNLTPEDLEQLARSTAGYSGADMACLSQEAAMGPIREISMKDLQNVKETAVRPVNNNDFQMALKRVKATVNQEELDSYVEWDKTYGCG